MKQTTYHIGGAKAGPAGNRAEELDSVAATFTRWSPAGVVVEQRALTTAEAASLASQEAGATRMGNDATLKSRASQALAANATYLALATPTAAQNTAQAKTLTRQVNGLIRLLLNQLDSIADA